MVPCQPGPPPVCSQNQQIQRGCRIHCPPLSLHTAGENKQLHQNAVFNFISAFSTISPMTLIGKLKTLGSSTTLRNVILDFLTNRPQTAQIGSYTSSALVLNTGAPPGLCGKSHPVHTVLPWSHSQTERIRPKSAGTPSFTITSITDAYHLKICDVFN